MRSSGIFTGLRAGSVALCMTLFAVSADAQGFGPPPGQPSLAHRIDLHGDAPVSLVVIHSHSHGDHTAADAQFQAMADVQFIAAAPPEIQKAAGIARCVRRDMLARRRLPKQRSAK